VTPLQDSNHGSEQLCRQSLHRHPASGEQTSPKASSGVRDPIDRWPRRGGPRLQASPPTAFRRVPEWAALGRSGATWRLSGFLRDLPGTGRSRGNVVKPSALHVPIDDGRELTSSPSRGGQSSGVVDTRDARASQAGPVAKAHPAVRRPRRRRVVSEATDASTTTAEKVTQGRPTAPSRTGCPCASRTTGRSCRPDSRAARRPGVAGRRSATRTGTAVASESWADARSCRFRREGHTHRHAGLRRWLRVAEVAVDGCTWPAPFTGTPPPRSPTSGRPRSHTSRASLGSAATRRLCTITRPVARTRCPSNSPPP
jgi:hypothetical protein